MAVVPNDAVSTRIVFNAGRVMSYSRGTISSGMAKSTANRMPGVRLMLITVVLQALLDPPGLPDR